MSTHSGHPAPSEREAFLVDGCPRCEEYVRDLGIHFDEDRFRAFWTKMIEVEYDDNGGYASHLDKTLGRQLFYITLALQRAFNFDPRSLR